MDWLLIKIKIEIIWVRYRIYILKFCSKENGFLMLGNFMDVLIEINKLICYLDINIV